MDQLSSIQPEEFAQPECFYDVAGTIARCVCGDTIRIKRDGDWHHSHRGDVWCRASRK